MILLLGGSGYVGSAFQRVLESQGVPFLSISRSDLDYSQPDQLADYIRNTKATFLINCAGFTGRPNVDACETQKTETLFGNSVLPGRIAEACERTRTPWGHVSSGCIFSGDGPDGEGFRETDSPNFDFRRGPCSFYSGTKSLGEEILANKPEVFIWRLRIPFNSEPGPRNYLTKLMSYDRLLEARNSISHLEEFALSCWKTWAQRVPFGTYHVTNPGSILTSEIVDMIRKSSVSAKEFSFFESEEEFMKCAAITPRSNCVLSTEKLSSVGITMTEVHEAVERSLAEWPTSKS